MKVYLDNSATTRMSEEVFEAMKPYFTEVYGNANSQHSFGQAAAKAVANARKQIAEAIGAKNTEIYFTSGGTEADNWALRGAMTARKSKGNHLIVSSIEHSAILTTAKLMEKEGYKVTYLPVNELGIVDLEALKNAITDQTVLISVMLANNEIGTIQPIEEIVKIAKNHGTLVHTDAVQAIGSIEVDVKALGIDMLSISAHKFYGPKGIGALYIKTGLKLTKLVSGGEQERTMRGGTTNVAAVVGMAAAITAAVRDRQENVRYICSLRDRLVSRIEKEIPNVYYNGDRQKRLPQNANFSFEFIEGESILLRLDLAGIAVSSGSACSSNSLEPSHTLLAIGRPHELAHGSLRFSFGKYNTQEEVDFVVDKLKIIVQQLRELSPLFVNIRGENKYV